MRISREFCLKCKGRLWCGLKYCPLMVRFRSLKEINLKDSFEGSSVDVFVGRFNYPNINVGSINIPKIEPKDAKIFENHKEWLKNKFQLNEIITIRSQTVYSYKKENIKKFEEKIEEIGLSKKPLFVSVYLKNKPVVKLNAFNDFKLFGARGKLKNINIEDTPKIPQKVDKIINDEIKAKDAVIELSKRYDLDYIRRIFSIGKLGQIRRLVPTRWSITAIDDILGKDLIEKIKKFNPIKQYELYFGYLYGNYFLVLLIPGYFSYELFEMISFLKPPIIEPQYTHDYELIFNRKNYAESTAGGYYAMRYSVLNHLNKRKVNASVIIFRIVTPKYTVPLGVWVVREGINITMNQKIKIFDSLKESTNFITDFVKRNFFLDLRKIIEESKLIKFYTNQKKILDFFKK